MEMKRGEDVKKKEEKMRERGRVVRN